jgi:hypothetical protein
VQLDFFVRFKKDHPHVSVCLRAFASLKPFYVRRLKERDTCACKYHVEMLELLHGWNNMQGGVKGVHGKNCDCSCNVCDGGAPGKCMVKFMHFGGLTDLWMSILCPVLKNKWYKLDCLMGWCSECGQEMLMTCPTEVHECSDRLVQWNCYQKVVAGKTKKRKEYKVLRLQYKHTSPRQYFQYMKP